MATHTHTQKRTLLKAFVDLHVRFLFQNSIRLKSPEAQLKRGGGSDGMSVEDNRNLLTALYCSCPCTLLELGEAVLPESREFVGKCVCRVVFKPDLMFLCCYEWQSQVWLH